MHTNARPPSGRREHQAVRRAILFGLPQAARKHFYDKVVYADNAL